MMYDPTQTITGGWTYNRQAWAEAMRVKQQVPAAVEEELLEAHEEPFVLFNGVPLVYRRDFIQDAMNGTLGTTARQPQEEAQYGPAHAYQQPLFTTNNGQDALERFFRVQLAHRLRTPPTATAKAHAIVLDALHCRLMAELLGDPPGGAMFYQKVPVLQGKFNRIIWREA